MTLMSVGTLKALTPTRSTPCSSISTTAGPRRKARFGAEFFPAQLPEGISGRAFLEFFQIDRQTGEPKGIIELKLDDG
jgi:hypothetical protein